MILSPRADFEIVGLYNVFWPFFIGNCHLNRNTHHSIMQAGEWEKIELTLPTREDAWSVFPRIHGRLWKKQWMLFIGLLVPLVYKYRNSTFSSWLSPSSSSIFKVIWSILGFFALNLVRGSHIYWACDICATRESRSTRNSKSRMSVGILGKYPITFATVCEPSSNLAGHFTHEARAIDHGSWHVSLVNPWWAPVKVSYSHRGLLVFRVPLSHPIRESVEEANNIGNAYDIHLSFGLRKSPTNHEERLAASSLHLPGESLGLESLTVSLG